MRLRPVVLCAVLLAMALGAAGCSSGGSSSGGSTGSGTSTSQTPTGTVTVRSGGKVICVMKLKDGKGTCTMSTKGYQPGTVPLTATYSGDHAFKSAKTSTKVDLLKPTSQATTSSP